MLCHAMLCYAMLCYAMLCYAMLCYGMLCYGMLYYDDCLLDCANGMDCLFIDECADAERESADGSCKAWQKTNACSSHPVLMRTYCPKTCGLCSMYL